MKAASLRFDGHMTTTPITAAIDALATFRLTRLVTEDTFPPIRRAREWIWDRFPPIGRTVHVDDGWHLRTHLAPPLATRWHKIAGYDVHTAVVIEGGIVPNVGGEAESAVVTESHPIGELIGCPWCVSIHIGAGVVLLRMTMPGLWDPLARLLAFSAVSGVVATHT